MFRATLAMLLAMCLSAAAAEPLLGRIVYRTSKITTDGVWTMDAAGGNHAQLVGPADAGPPRWSPDGERVAVGHKTYAAAGFDARPASPDDTILDWSRDGEWFAVAVKGRGERYGVGKIRVDGTGFRQLTELPFSHVPSAEWSRDGSQLLVTGRFGRLTVAVYLLDAATGDLEPFVDSEAADSGAQWSADGESVYYVAGGGALGGLRRVDLADRSVHDLNPNWQRRRLFAVSPDGAYLLAHRTVELDAPLDMAIYDLNGRLVHSLDDEASSPIAADWFIPRSLLPVSPAGMRTVSWAALRAGN
jgi:Tol biopolymer transport system component